MENTLSIARNEVTELPLAKAPDRRLVAAVKDFEAILLGQMMKDMRHSIPDSGLLGGGSQEEMMRDLLDEEWTRQLAQGRGIGLAQVLLRQLQPAQ